MNGVIIVNKPQDFTSFDIVAVMRKCCGQKKIGHTGTLDPMATGVLPILLGNATKAQDILPDSHKEYIAEFQLGKTSNTLDIWGEIISECECRISKQDILDVLPNFIGDIEQIPPMYSAVKKNGVRLYELARKGIEIERNSRKVTVSEISLLNFDENCQVGKIKIACSKGTYIRSLIDDIGKKLGCGAVMTSLVRTKACGFTLEQSKSLDELKQLTPQEIENLTFSTESLFEDYQKIILNSRQAFKFSNGSPVDIDKTNFQNIQNNQILRICGKNGNFIGLGIVDTSKNIIGIYKMFP